MKKNLLIICSSLLSCSVFASPVALVEDVSDSVTGIALLDYLEQGSEVDLGTDGSLSLGYIGSCIHEQITGGKVKVGNEQSDVDGGQVTRQTTQCDGARLALAANESAQSGAMAFREINADTASELTIQDVSPVVVLPKAGKLTIKRLDQIGERYRLRPNGDGRIKVDLAREAIRLTPGAKYMITSSGRSLVFDVSADAEHNPGNLLGRLIPL